MADPRDHVDLLLAEFSSAISTIAGNEKSGLQQVLNGATPSAGGVPDMAEYMKRFAMGAAELEAKFFAAVNELTMSRDDVDALCTDAKTQASMITKNSSRDMLKQLNVMFTPYLNESATPVLRALEVELEALINDMKGRELQEVVMEREIYDTYHRFCEADAKRAALIKVPQNTSLAMGLLEKAKKHFDAYVEKPRSLAKRQMKLNQSNNRDWSPDPSEVSQRIARGVNLLKERVQFSLENMKRRAGEKGFSRAAFSGDLNDYFFCVQEGILAGTGVWGTQYEDRVALAFEEACGPCNVEAMRLYENVVDERLKTVKSIIIARLKDLFVDKHKAAARDSQQQLAALEKDATSLMGELDMSAEQQESLARAMNNELLSLRTASQFAGWKPASAAAGAGSKTQFSSGLESLGSRKRERERSPPPPASATAAARARVPASTAWVVDTTTVGNDDDHHSAASSGGSGSGSSSNSKRPRQDTLEQAKRDAEESQRKRSEEFKNGHTKKKATTPAKKAAAVKPPGPRASSRGKVRVAEPATSNDKQQQEPAEVLSPLKRRRMGTGGAARESLSPPPPSSVTSSRGRCGGGDKGSKKRKKAGDESDDTATTAAVSGESTLERSKREAREAVSRRAAEYVASEAAKKKRAKKQ